MIWSKLSFSSIIPFNVCYAIPYPTSFTAVIKYPPTNSGSSFIAYAYWVSPSSRFFIKRSCMLICSSSVEKATAFSRIKKTVWT